MLHNPWLVCKTILEKTEEFSEHRTLVNTEVSSLTTSPVYTGSERALVKPGYHSR